MSPLRAPVSLQPSGRLASGGRDGDRAHRTSLARHLSGARGRDRRYPRRTPPPGREEREVCRAVPTTSVVFCLFFVSPRKHLGRMRLGFTCRTSCQQVSRLGGGSYIRGTFGDGQTGRGGATDLGGVHAGWAVLHVMPTSSEGASGGLGVGTEHSEDTEAGCGGAWGSRDQKEQQVPSCSALSWGVASPKTWGQEGQPSGSPAQAQGQQTRRRRGCRGHPRGGRWSRGNAGPRSAD